jgi:outer membrane protein assembly factor BamB
MAILAGVCWAQVQSGAGYRGDGTGVYKDANPPLEFAYPGKLVKWDVALPSWGHSSPIVAGNRIFVTCDWGLTNDWPLLLCLDAATGKTLWSRDLNHLAALESDAQKRQALADDWHVMREHIRKLKQAQARTRAGGDAAVSNSDATEAAPAATLRESPMRERVRRLNARGIWHETWNEGLFHNRNLACIGYVYGTPVCDGQRVWAVTSFGGIFCFDLDGNLRWNVALPIPKPSGIQHFGPPEHCQNGRSPLLYKDILISDITGYVRALDKKTGQVLWVSDGPAREKSSTIVSPAVLRIGNTDVLWTAGPCAYRLPDGKRLTIDGWKDEGMQVLVKYDEPDVAWFCGSGEHCGWTAKGHSEGGPNPPAAVRFRLDGDTLKAQVLWHGGTLPAGDVLGGNAPWMLYHHGRFYHRNGAILDALSGKLLAGAFSRSGPGRAVPQTAHLLQVAGNHVFGLGRAPGRDQEGAALMEVFTLDGKPVARNILQKPVLTPDQRRMFAATAGTEEIPRFSEGWAFTFSADRIYIRSYGNLICIGR